MPSLHNHLQLRREPSFADDLDRLFIPYLTWRYSHRGLDPLSFNAIDVLLPKLFGLRCRVLLIDPTKSAIGSGTNIKGNALNGKAISLPTPEYPVIARQAGASGSVTVQVTVDEEGNVISANATSGHPLLRAAAVTAAKQAKFSPTKLNGELVKVTGVLTYFFTVQ